jgi:hypothetical protein
VIGTAANDARTEPLKIGAGRGSIRFAFDLPRAIGRQKLAKVRGGVATDAGAAMRKVVGPQEHLEIFFRVDLRAGLQQRHGEAAFGENFRGHSAAGSGADDDDVVGFGSLRDLSHRE